MPYVVWRVRCRRACSFQSKPHLPKLYFNVFHETINFTTSDIDSLFMKHRPYHGGGEVLLPTVLV